MRAYLRTHGVVSQEDAASAVAHFEMRVRLSLDPEGAALDIDATQRDVIGRHLSTCAACRGTFDAQRRLANDLAALILAYVRWASKSLRTAAPSGSRSLWTVNCSIDRRSLRRDPRHQGFILVIRAGITKLNSGPEGLKND